MISATSKGPNRVKMALQTRRSRAKNKLTSTSVDRPPNTIPARPLYNPLKMSLFARGLHYFPPNGRRRTAKNPRRLLRRTRGEVPVPHRCRRYIRAVRHPLQGFVRHAWTGLTCKYSVAYNESHGHGQDIQGTRQSGKKASAGRSTGAERADVGGTLLAPRHDPPGGHAAPKAYGGRQLGGDDPPGTEKLHYLNPVPIHGIFERWIVKYERQRLNALRELKERAEGDPNG